MKTFSTRCDNAGFAHAMAKAREIAPQITVVFGASGFFTDKDAVEKPFAGAAMNIIGCATAWEISAEGSFGNSCTLLAMHFNATEVKTADAAFATAEQARAAGLEIGKKLGAPNLAGIFVLLPPIPAGGTEFARAIAENVSKRVVITGGVTSDSQTFLNGRVQNDRVVAFALYGDKVAVTSGTGAGWKSFGPIRRVTKVAGNILLELDGKPAATIYAEYLRDKAGAAPYPFSILREDNREDTGIIRSVLSIDENAGSLTLGGEVPQNSLLRLMHADTGSMVAAARAAASPAVAANGASLIMSGLCRKLVMGSDGDEERAAVMAGIGHTAVAGFYSLAEIAPSATTGAPELQNGTLTVTTITETA